MSPCIGSTASSLLDQQGKNDPNCLYFSEMHDEVIGGRMVGIVPQGERQRGCWEGETGEVRRRRERVDADERSRKPQVRSS